MGEISRDFYLGFVSANGKFKHYKNVKISWSGSEWAVNEWRFLVKGERGDLVLLKTIQHHLGVGKIKKDRGLYILAVTSWKQCLSNVIPYFDGLLAGHRREEFSAWAESIENHSKRKNRQ